MRTTVRHWKGYWAVQSRPRGISPQDFDDAWLIEPSWWHTTLYGTRKQAREAANAMHLVNANRKYRAVQVRVAVHVISEPGRGIRASGLVAT
jgi:hypothetical protein